MTQKIISPDKSSSKILQTIDPKGIAWDYYRELLAYSYAPSPEAAQLLKAKFRLLFETPSGYELLDERKQLTAAKESELLRVLAWQAGIPKP